MYTLKSIKLKNQMKLLEDLIDIATDTAIGKVNPVKRTINILDTLTIAVLEYTVGIKNKDKYEVNLVCTEEIQELLTKKIEERITTPWTSYTTLEYSTTILAMINGITFNFVIKSKEELRFKLEDKIIEYTEIQDSKSNGALFKIRIPNEKLLNL